MKVIVLILMVAVAASLAEATISVLHAAPAGSYGPLRSHDPLTEAEHAELKKVGMTQPRKRLQLYIRFDDARLNEIDRLRNDLKQATDRGKHIHDLLSDFTAILDDINADMDTFESSRVDPDRKADMKAGFKDVSIAGSRWLEWLQKLQAAARNDPQTRSEAMDFQFALQDSIDAVKSAADVAAEYSESK